MTIPTDLVANAIEFSSEFGGIQELFPYITEYQFLKTILFAGPIIIIKPWALEIDLRDYGFIQGFYRVYNSKQQFLYECLSPSGYFGRDPKDLDACIRTSNGQSLYLSFFDNQQPVVLKLACCTKSSTQEMVQYIESWESTVERLYPKPTEHELILERAKSLKNHNLKIYFLGVSWLPTQSINSVRSSPTNKSVELGSNEVSTLYPKESGWYLFEDLTDNRILKLSSLKGDGLVRLKDDGTGAYYINTTSQDLNKVSTRVDQRGGVYLRASGVLS